MKRYVVLYSDRNSEYTIICYNPEEDFATEHSGPYPTTNLADEVADALNFKMRADLKNE